MTQEELWSSIESTSHQFEENVPVILQGKTVFENSTHAQKEMFNACTMVSSFMLDLTHNIPSHGKVLDLGCGRGMNSHPLLMKGWDVTAVDTSSDLLTEYHDKATEFVENGQLELVNGDITEYEFNQNHYDIVFCIDTIPYIDSKKVKPLMEKINTALVTNGVLFGTIFFCSPTSEVIREIQQKVGAHFYEGKHIAPALLKHTGFDIKTCFIRADNGYVIAVEFEGIKK